MAGKHSVQSSGSKKPLVITLVIVAVVIIAAVVCVVVFALGGKSNSTASTTAPSVSTAAAASTTAETTQLTQPDSQQETANSEQKSSEQGSGVTLPQESVDIVVPTNGGEAKANFNATYVPYRAVDTYTGSDMALRDFFGTSYAEGVLTFNSDGTFTDTLITTDNNSGAYVVEDDSINATYTNDKNISITVSSWNGDTPSEIIVHYNGADVYFRG